jgi:hypothetical protein
MLGRLVERGNQHEKQRANTAGHALPGANDGLLRINVLTTRTTVINAHMSAGSIS